MYEIKNTVYCKGQGWRSKLINSQTKLHLKWFLIAQKAVSKFWIFKARIMVYLMGLMRFNTYPCFDVLAKACPSFECYLQINNHWKSAIQNCTWKLKRIIPQTMFTLPIIGYRFHQVLKTGTNPSPNFTFVFIKALENWRSPPQVSASWPTSGSFSEL